MADPRLVSISRREGIHYPLSPPFHPSTRHPEYPYPPLISSEPNGVYDLVRDALAGLGLDARRFGTPDWNPLGDLVGSSGHVLIKPNLVLDSHPRGGDIRCLITHGSIIRPLLDYAAIALRGKGRIVVGDAPIQTTDFNRATEVSGLKGVVEFYQSLGKVDVQLVDFRKIAAERDAWNHILAWHDAAGDPAGYVSFDLAADSLLAPLDRDSARFRVSNYPANETRRYHGGGSHTYVLARTAMDADLILNVPKMKTHCKVGVTLGLKNFVGIVGRKECLAHHREGGSAGGGDEYSGASWLKRVSTGLEGLIDGRRPGFGREVLKLVYRANERILRALRVNPIRDGSWHGNDTAWRMALDLVRLAVYGKADGSVADAPQRKVLTVIDGIVAGEGEGPLEATPRSAGTLIAGMNPAATDAATATLMGFDHTRIPLLRNAFVAHAKKLAPFSYQELRWRLNGKDATRDALAEEGARNRFRPPDGWGNLAGPAQPTASDA